VIEESEKIAEINSELIKLAKKILKNNNIVALAEKITNAS